MVINNLQVFMADTSALNTDQIISSPTNIFMKGEDQAYQFKNNN